MLSFRSQIKLIPEDLSNVASEGKLGRRHPDSARKGRICNLDSTLLKKKNSSSIKSPVQKYIEKTRNCAAVGIQEWLKSTAIYSNTTQLYISVVNDRAGAAHMIG